MELVNAYYKGIYLSKYYFCEYTNYKDIFINTFYFIDTEKINRFRHFIRESATKRAFIICDSELEPRLKKELPDTIYCVVDIEDYVDKEQRHYYDEI